MNDDFVAPVKGITKALDTGIKLARRISRSASAPSAAQTLQITETARSLQKALEGSAQAIGDVYRACVEPCRGYFPKALLEDLPIQTRLKELRIELIDLLNECQDFEEDEPDTFDQTHFTNLQSLSQKCAAECVSMFNTVRDRILRDGGGNSVPGEMVEDDRAQLSSMKKRLSIERKAVPPPTPPAIALASNRPALSVLPPAVEPVMPKSPWAIDSPAEFSIGSPLDPSLSKFPRHPSRDLSPSSKSKDPPPSLIPKEIVNNRLSANDEFLERRRRSRILFQKEFRHSVSSIEENRASVAFSDSSILNSPTVGFLNMASTSAERKKASDQLGGGPLGSPIPDDPRNINSPLDGRASRTSSSGYDTLMTRQRSLGGASQTSGNSRNGSMVQNTLQRTGSQASEESIFGLRNQPLSPPLSDRGSGTDQWGTLATTLQLPGFGQGVEPGLEVVNHVDHDNGLILASENNFYQPTPTGSMKLTDHPMRHDSSFYRFGGFCEGAKSILRGEVGYKVIKRPLGQFSSILSGRCTKCSYEVGWNEIEKDRTLERSGIYGNSGIRWRQKFISKCHIRTNSVEEPMYACIFCIDDHKTVEEHDATIFFSVGALFRHLARHPQPVPKIPGIDVLYGNQPPHLVDFDLHFTTSVPKFSEFSMMQIATKVATRPSANANATHHPKNTRSSSRDPEGNATLHFAAGARIVGITFPDRFNGQWCIGYHDGERGSFPASSIALELPLREDVLMNAQSTLVAFAKWDFKPKEAKDGGWLKFSKGERISAVGYTFQDQWCWSGQTSKGKWGLFPAAFVDNLQEVQAPKPGSSPGSVRSGGLGLRIGSISLGSKRSDRSGSGSIASTTTPVAERVQSWQPGLEVVNSRTNSWRQ